MVSFIITIIVFAILEISCSKVKAIYLEIQNARVTEINEINKSIEQEQLKPKQYYKIETKENEEINLNDIWQIEIPKINLIAPISEGTSQEVMSKYVGHFENTKTWVGNIGLAAHNRRISC